MTLVRTFAGRPDHGGLCLVLADLAYFRNTLVNVYFAGWPGAGDREWVLVDTGLPGSAARIASLAAERFSAGARPSAIILTHGHFDHVGAVQELADKWDAPVYAHPLEHPYLNGRSAYPPPDPTVGGGAMAAMSRFFPRGPIDLGPRLHALPPDGSVPGMAEWQWIHTPGHSPGHVSLWREDDRSLIAGDAFVTTKQESAIAVFTQRVEVHGPPAYYTVDWAAARRSVERLAALEPEVAATGHGVPMGGPTLRGELRKLASSFDLMARPRRGRYVRQPAITDARGVVAVPPPVRDPWPGLIAGIGAAALVGGLAWRRGRRRSPAGDAPAGRMAQTR